MTHDELLARIESYIEPDDCDCWQCGMANALRAVVEIHKPMGFLDICESCEEREYQGGEGYEVRYPCPTIQAIEKEMG